jgi:hypothetical protein
LIGPLWQDATVAAVSCRYSIAGCGRKLIIAALLSPMRHFKAQGMSNDPGRTRTPSLWDEITGNRVIFLSTVGSVASIAALIITLMDKIVLEKGLDP